MVRHLIRPRAEALLGRGVTEEFVTAILDGDPFVYEARRDTDREAARVVLGLATGRLSEDREASR